VGHRRTGTLSIPNSQLFEGLQRCVRGVRYYQYQSVDDVGSNSFESIGKWIDFVRESRGSDTLIFVVGNKLDLETDRNVNSEKAEAQVKAQGINYYEVSAKTGRNLNDMFKSLCSILLNAPVDRIIDKADKSIIPTTPTPPTTAANNVPAKVATKPDQTEKPLTPTQNKSTVLVNPQKGPQRIKQRNCC